MDTLFSSKRGWFLTILIYLAGFRILRSLLAPGLNPFVGVLPNTFVILVIMVTVLEFFALWGLWFWKRIAVYLWFLLGATELIYTLTFILSISKAESKVTNISSAIIIIAGEYALWYWAINRKWKLFT